MKKYNQGHQKLSEYDYTKQKAENTTGPSLTMPGQTLSLKDLLKNYTRGGAVATLTPVYTSDENGQIPDEILNGPDFEKLTHIERIELARETKAHIAEMQEQLKLAAQQQEQLLAQQQAQYNKQQSEANYTQSEPKNAGSEKDPS